MNPLEQRRSVRTGNQVLLSHDKYTAICYVDLAEDVGLAVIERGIATESVPPQLRHCPHQYFPTDDVARIAQWPTVPGTDVALVLCNATGAERFTITHLLQRCGARRVVTYRVGGECK